MAFTKRFVKVASPDYPDAIFDLLANPLGKLFDALLIGGDDLGAALVEVYGGGKVEAYGVVFDFSAPDTAMATLNHPDIPADLRYWLRNAPLDLVLHERDRVSKNFPASLVRGN